MPAMTKCGHCGGFVPGQVAECPHCAAGAPQRPALRRLLVGGVAAGFISVTLMACYGPATVPPDCQTDGPLPDECIAADGGGSADSGQDGG